MRHGTATGVSTLVDWVVVAKGFVLCVRSVCACVRSVCAYVHVCAVCVSECHWAYYRKYIDTGYFLSVIIQ